MLKLVRTIANSYRLPWFLVGCLVRIKCTISSWDHGLIGALAPAPGVSKWGPADLFRDPPSLVFDTQIFPKIPKIYMLKLLHTNFLEKLT